MNDYVAERYGNSKSLTAFSRRALVFSERGIAQVILPETAKAAGVGIVTLSRYFPTKTDLVVAIDTCKLNEVID